jgi:NADPH-dependent curcumin reductase CurA
MRKDGRVLVVGSIENYNDVDKRSVPATNISILMKGITVKGFLVYFFGQNEWANAFTQMNKLIQEVIILFLFC